MKHNIKVYDLGNKAFDRYTVIINNDVYGMSTDADSPQGFNQYAGTKQKITGTGTDHLGESVDIMDLPLSVRIGIGQRIA